MNASIETFEWALSKGSVGILSLVILALVYVVKNLWDKLDKLQGEKDALHALRVTDAEKTTKTLLEITAKTHELIDSLGQAAEVFEQVQRADNPLRRTNSLCLSNSSTSGFCLFGLLPLRQLL